MVSCGADVRRADAMVRHLLDLEKHLRRLQRIAADLEEVVIHADVRAVQKPLPYLGDQDFQRRCRHAGWPA